jgi:hypothetical protein
VPGGVTGAIGTFTYQPGFSRPVSWNSRPP